MEFYALSRETGDMKYAKAAAKPLIEVHRMNPKTYLLPSHLYANGRMADPQVYTTGALADSYYEYLLKVRVQAGKNKEEMVHDTGKRWEHAMDAWLDFFVYRDGNM